MFPKMTQLMQMRKPNLYMQFPKQKRYPSATTQKTNHLAPIGHQKAAITRLQAINSLAIATLKLELVGHSRLAGKRDYKPH